MEERYKKKFNESRQYMSDKDFLELGFKLVSADKAVDGSITKKFSHHRLRNRMLGYNNERKGVYTIDHHGSPERSFDNIAQALGVLHQFWD
jgi:hypothetical protein